MVFCEYCGASLIGQQPLDTKSLDSAKDAAQMPDGVDAEALANVRAQGTATFKEGDHLRLEVEGCPEPLLFVMKDEAVFGRKDPATGAMPDIDLTPYAGYRMGVSRRHAAISRSVEHGLDVRDLGSSNGTFLNGQQLVAHRLYRLRNGDELRLGQMVIRLLFEPTKAAQSAPAEEKAPETPAEQAPAQASTTQRPSQSSAEDSAAPPEQAQPAAAEPAKEVAAKSAPSPDSASAPSAQTQKGQSSPAQQPAASASEPEKKPAQPSGAASAKDTGTASEKSSQSSSDPSDKDKRG